MQLVPATAPKQICSDLQTRMAYTESEPGPLTQIQPAVAVWDVRAGNVFT